MGPLLDDPAVCENIRRGIQPMREEHDDQTIANHWARWLPGIWPGAKA
jgi:hypothetical protein